MWDMVYCEKNSSSYGIQGALRVRSVVLFQASSSLGAVGHPCGACCFKTVSNAIELAMIASLTALMQACKRVAPSARVINLTECSAKVQCISVRVAVHKLSVNKCMRCSQLYSMRSVDHGAVSARLVQGWERSFSGQGPGLSSKCSAEVLNGQLVSAVLRSSVG